MKGVLVTPFILSTYYGNYDVQEETFYKQGELYYFKINQNVYPWKIVYAIKVPHD